MGNRTTFADALHQAGEAARAQALFEEAEALQAEWQPQYPRLYSLPGYRLLRSAARPGPRRRGARAGGVCARIGYAGSRNGCSTSPWITSPSAGRRWRWASLARPGRSSTRRSTACARRARSATCPAACWRARRCSGRPAILRRPGAIWTRRCGSRGAARCGFTSAMPISNTPGSRSRRATREKAREHLAEARRLVEETGYGRRRPEVEALEALVG